MQIEEYYKKYGPMVLRRCTRILGDSAAAEEAAQDVFVQFLRYQQVPEIAAPSSLLYTIATRVCLNLIRDRKAEGTWEPSEPSDAKDLIDKAIDYYCFEEQVVSRNFLSRLFHREQPSTVQMVLMHYLDQMTYSEIASEMGMSVSGIRKRLRQFQEKTKMIGVHE